MSHCAIVTGASSGIGKAISERLLQLGYEVYGTGRTFTETIENENFHPVVFDLLNTKQLLAFAKDMQRKEVDLLINNAGCAYYGMHETLSYENIQEMVRVNLEIPMILSGELIRTLRKTGGTIINIASVTALKESTHGAVYGATKAGLLHFSRTLFAENRKHGVNVAVILPDMTDTALYRNADFMADERTGYSLSVSDVADAVEYILHASQGGCVNEVILRPQYHSIVRKKREGR